MATRASRSGNPAVRGGAQPPRETPPHLVTPPSKTVEPGMLPEDGVRYPLSLRTSGSTWWRSVLGVFFGVSLYFLFVTVVSRTIVRLAWALEPTEPYATFYAAAFAYERPVGLLAVLLGLSTLLPIAMVLTLVIQQVRPRWLFSVLPGVRWRFLLACLVPSFVALGAVTVLPSLAGWTGLHPQPHFWLFLVVIVLVSPVQAAAEETFFRGFVLQSFGSILTRPWFGVVSSAVMFAILHGTQNLALFVNRLAFGLLFAVLAWWVGGIEAGIAAHVANNVLSFTWAGLTSTIATVGAVRSVTWGASAVQILGFVLCAGFALLVARLMKLRTRVDLGAPGVRS